VLLVPQSESPSRLVDRLPEMEPRRFELVPGVAPDVSIHVEDVRESMSPDEDLIEIGFSMECGGGFAFAVTLSLDEIVLLRDALSEIANTPLA
jgi:hypothetical protein